VLTPDVLGRLRSVNPRLATPATADAATVPSPRINYCIVVMWRSMGEMKNSTQWSINYGDSAIEMHTDAHDGQGASSTIRVRDDGAIADASQGSKGWPLSPCFAVLCCAGKLAGKAVAPWRPGNGSHHHPSNLQTCSSMLPLDGDWHDGMVARVGMHRAEGQRNGSEMAMAMAMPSEGRVCRVMVRQGVWRKAVKPARAGCTERDREGQAAGCSCGLRAAVASRAVCGSCYPWQAAGVAPSQHFAEDSPIRLR